MKVTLLDVMGDDLRVVNAARVSHGKWTDTFRDRDARLLRFLAEHGHWTPFAHPQLSFRFEFAMPVAAQLSRHEVGKAKNEVSRRYVTDTPRFDLPRVWRSVVSEPHASKQGSGAPIADQETAIRIAEAAVAHSHQAYNGLLALGVAPEQARYVLVQAVMTEWIWTGSLYRCIEICRERLAPDAQAETAEPVRVMAEAVREHFPHSWAAWQGVLPEQTGVEPALPGPGHIYPVRVFPIGEDAGQEHRGETV